MTVFIGHFFSAYFTTQLVILPLLLYYLFFDYTRIGPVALRRMRIVVSVLPLILPFLFCGFTLFSLSHGGSVAGVDMEPGPLTVVTGHQAPVAWDAAAGSVVAATPILHSFSEPFSIIDTVISHLSLWLALAGGAGLLLFLFKSLVKTRHLRVIMGESRLTTMAGWPVYRSRLVREPFSLWLGRNVIFMPESSVGAEDQTILYHEGCHIRRNHTLWAVFENILVHLFWYNPLIYFLNSRNRLIREVECDLEVSNVVGRRAYIETMMNHAAQTMAPGRFSGSTGWKKTAFRKRIQSLLADPDAGKTASVRRGYVALLGLTLVLSTVVSGCLSAQDETGMVKEINDTYHHLVQTHGETPLSAMPEHLVRIFLLREDKSFYEHHGLDYSATLRAALNNLLGNPKQGASTITQQLAKRLLYESEPKNLKRKLKQIEAAGVLEKHFSKNRIMEMYLNAVYFGEGVYGISAAARHYFKHPVEALTPAEISALAVMVSNPKENSFKKSPQTAAYLQEKLFQRMVADGILTPEDAAKNLEIFHKEHPAF